MLCTGIHPTIISESFQKALDKGIEVLTNMAQPVELSDRETLLNSATTSLNSKVRLHLDWQLQPSQASQRPKSKKEQFHFLCIPECGFSPQHRCSVLAMEQPLRKCRVKISLLQNSDIKH